MATGMATKRLILMRMGMGMGYACGEEDENEEGDGDRSHRGSTSPHRILISNDSSVGREGVSSHATH